MPTMETTLTLTDANMSIFNDNPHPVTVTVTNNQDMEKKFPGSSTIAPAGVAEGLIAASSRPGQSSFDVNFASGETTQVELGTFFYSTSSTPQMFPDGKSAAVLAPRAPLITGVDYRLWFFNGPGLLHNLANSLLQANLPALLAYLKQHPQKIPFKDGVSFTLDGIETDPKTLQCVYASTLPYPSGSDWYLNIVLRAEQITVKGSVTIEGRSGDFDVSVSNLMMWLQVKIDPSLQTAPQVQQLQISLGDYSGIGSIFPILRTLSQSLNTLFELGFSAYRVAGAINNLFNVDITTAINDALRRFVIPGTVSSAGLGANGVHEPEPSATSQLVDSPLMAANLSPGPAGGDLSTWMSNPQIQERQLGAVKIPGTHDSGTYQLTSTLSQMQYHDTALLFKLRPGTAPVNNEFPKNPIYLGQQLYDWVMGVGVNSDARTQDMTILQQLQSGVRHFDFRVYYDTIDSNFYIHHATRGPKISDLLAQMQQFLAANPTAAELIFVYVSHTNFGHNPSYRKEFTTLVNSMISSSNIYFQPVPPGQTLFDFQSLATQTIGSITSGTSKIMFINGNADRFTYDDTVTNTKGYAGVGWPGNVYTVQRASEEQGPKMQGAHDPLWAVNWSLDADTPTIVRTILTNLTNVLTWALPDIATKANAALSDFFGYYGVNFTLLTLDYPELGGPYPKYGGATNAIEMIINMNKV